MSRPEGQSPQLKAAAGPGWCPNRQPNPKLERASKRAALHSKAVTSPDSPSLTHTEAEMFIPTIEKRLLKATRSIVLIKLATAANADEAQMDVEDVLAALRPLAIDI